MNHWSEFEGADNRQILSWAEAQPWAREMARCQQDAQWHAEGDVWTHTRMVYAALEMLPECPGLVRQHQIMLLLAALFHDSGKPATTVLEPETGRIRSPNHSQTGANLTRRILRELECNVALREQIVALVRYHSRPAYLMEKKQPEREVLSLSWLVNNRLLYLLSLADTLGRKTVEMTRPAEGLHFWKILAEEQNCLDQPYSFANDQARFLFYRNQLSSLHYVPHEEYRCRVTLMAGLPGAGKDTWLAGHRPGLPVVSLDEIRGELEVDATDEQGEVIQTARERCREHLRAGRDFAFNATNITWAMRQRWIGLFADYAARVEVVYLEPPLRIIREQNRNRDKKVPENVMDRLIEKCEPPTAMEAHTVTLI